jgi:hypothetical protein
MSGHAPRASALRRNRLSTRVIHAEPERCLVDVVAAASQLNISARGLSAVRVRHHMVELEKAALGAAPLPADERTLPVVAPPHLPFDDGRDVTAARSRGPRGRRWARARGQLRLCGLSSRRVNARSKMGAGSRSGITWRSRSWARRSLSCVSREVLDR